MIFDTHAHYDSGAFNADRYEVLSQLPGEHVGAVVNPGCDLPSSRVAVELAKTFPHVWAAVGIHPSDCAGTTEAEYEALRELAKHEKVVAIGEIGLDYYWDTNPPREFQQEVFRRQIELALELESEYNSQKPCRGAVMDACFTRIVAALSRLYGLPVKRREISAVTNAAEYLDEHYMEEFPLKKAMELSNYSRRHFCRLFTEVYDISPQDYLLDVRMRHAADYLRNSGVSIADAAAMCGFSDSGYFSRVFKKHYGVLPSRYRLGKDE